MKFSQYLSAFSAGSVALLAFAGNASAIDVDVELSLLVDVSGSVDNTEFALQRDAYVNAFRDPDLINAFTSGPEGQIAVNFVYWSTEQVEAVPFTLINDAASSNAFADEIEAFARPGNIGASTGPGSAINFAVNSTDFLTNNFQGTRTIIDVSGDGAENTGDDTSTARDDALAAGIDAINGLAIGGNPAVETFYQDNIVGGTNAFFTSANSFQDFEVALEDKLLDEIVVEPIPFEAEGTMGLVALGGFFWYRKRQQQKRSADA